jgi:DNA modification methylase
MQTTPRKGRRKAKTPAAARPLEIENLPIASLKVDPQNPREHSAKQVRQIATSFETFGFNMPIAVDGGGMIISGHGRVRAAELLGYETVPVVRLEHLTPAQRRAFAIADNKIALNATWDKKRLAENLQQLSIEAEFSIETTGFEIAEADTLIEGLTLVEPETEALADDIPPLPASAPISRSGDIWVLGNHRMICANALEQAVYPVLMSGKRAAMVFTDPPYNVPIPGHVSGKGVVKHPNFAMACGEQTPKEFTAFLTTVAFLMRRHTASGAILYQCMDWRHIGNLMEAAQAAEFEHLNTCVWVKSNAGMGSLYRTQHEFIGVHKNGKAPHRNNVQLGRYGRNRSNVWQYAGANSFDGRTDEGNVLEMHPTVKPIAMVVDAILDCSARGDIVLDPFSGVGTTLLAAERTGRRCYGIEIEPAYVDHAIRRWQRHCGDDARHGVSGKTFNELIREREEGSGALSGH